MDKIALLTQILTTNPTDAFARYGLAMAYAAENKPEEALAEFTLTTTHNPDYVPAYQMSAQTLLKLGRTEEPNPAWKLASPPPPAPATPTPPAKCKPCSTT